MGRSIFDLSEEWISRNLERPVPYVPLFFRRLRDGTIEIYDPPRNFYRSARNLIRLAEILRYHYTCKECGGFHVEKVIDLTNPEDPKQLSFLEFLNLLEGKE
jgi:hypothetical protein